MPQPSSANRHPSSVILLVDDDPDDVELTMRSLRGNNLRNLVVVAHDGVEALDYLLGRGEHADRGTTAAPQFIILDLNMPRMGGIEFLKHLRGNERTKSIPVVVFTASTEEEDLVNSYHWGANSYVRKPMDIAKFIRAAVHLGMYWTMVNSPPAQRATSRLAPPPSSEDAQPGVVVAELSSRAILLVENNPGDQALAIHALKSIRISNPVVAVTDGLQAIQYLFPPGSHSHHDPQDLPALVVLDLVLPKIGGVQVLRHIRDNARTQALPVVVLTGSKDEQAFAQARALGANSIILKPFDLVQLIETVRQLGLYWLMLDERAK